MLNYAEAVGLLREYYVEDYLWVEHPAKKKESLDDRTRKCLDKLGINLETP